MSIDQKAVATHRREVAVLWVFGAISLAILIALAWTEWRQWSVV